MISHSFPYLGIAAKYRLDYGDVLQIADKSMKLGTMACPALNRVHASIIGNTISGQHIHTIMTKKYWKFIDDMMLAEIHMMQYRDGERDYITGEVQPMPVIVQSQ